MFAGHRDSVLSIQLLHYGGKYKEMGETWKVGCSVATTLVDPCSQTHD